MCTSVCMFSVILGVQLLVKNSWRQTGNNNRDDSDAAQCKLVV